MGFQLAVRGWVAGTRNINLMCLPHGQIEYIHHSNIGARAWKLLGVQQRDKKSTGKKHEWGEV